MKKLFVTLIGVLIFFSCNSDQKLTDKTIKSVHVKVEKAKLCRIPVNIIVDGYVSSDEVAFISPKINGYIEEFYVKPGDRVVKGDILVKIKNREIEEKLNSVKYNLNALKIQKKQVKISIQTYEKSIVQAKANFILAKKNFKRFKNLLKSESVTKQEFDRMKTEFINAKMEFKKAEDFLKINKLKLKEIDNRIKSLKSVFAEVQVASDYRFVKAPFNGVILEKYIDTGNLVQPGIKIFKIGGFNKVAYFSIPLKYKNFKSVTIDNSRVKVLEISPDIKRGTSQFTIKTTLPSKNFENGAYIKARLIEGVKSGVVIKNKYIKKYNELYYTYICKNGFVIKTFITGEFLKKDNFLVRTGIKTGENIIVSPIENFSENLKCIIK